MTEILPIPGQVLIRVLVLPEEPLVGVEQRREGFHVGANSVIVNS